MAPGSLILYKNWYVCVLHTHMRACTCVPSMPQCNVEFRGQLAEAAFLLVDSREQTEVVKLRAKVVILPLPAIL